MKQGTGNFSHLKETHGFPEHKDQKSLLLLRRANSASEGLHKSPLFLIVLQASAFLLILFPTVIAQDYPFDASLYDAEHITSQITVSSSINLVGTGRAQKLEATVYYVPEEAGPLEASPQPASTNPLVFSWQNVRQGSYAFTYTTTVDNSIFQPPITKQIPYPFSSPASVTQYLEPQEITNTNEAIQGLARELSQGTNAVEVSFTIATWVHQNIKYDLNSVTAEASQKSSWVMDNREGVCDELTSLFISLSREAGIPARFVSGIAYTNLQAYQDHWGPHGWAEIWLPDVGWVPVDVTFGQFGYVDVTHIPIRHSLDSKNTAIDFSLLGDRINMETKQLETQTIVTQKTGTATEPLTLSLEPLYLETGSQSGNTLTASVTNNAAYYIATDLYLATTPDTILSDKQQQQVLLPPKSTRKVTWRVTMPRYDNKFEYTVPFTIISQRAGNASTSVKGTTRAAIYPLPSKQATVTSLDVKCTQPESLYIGEITSVTCTSKGATLCTNTCSKDEKILNFTAISPGAFPVLVTAKAGSETGTAVVTFIAIDRPAPAITMTLPLSVQFASSMSFGVKVGTAPITDATVSVQGKWFSHHWNASVLESKSYELRLPATYLDYGENTITVTVRGKDKNGEEVSAQSEATIMLEATFFERVQLFFSHLLSNTGTPN